MKEKQKRHFFMKNFKFIFFILLFTCASVFADSMQTAGQQLSHLLNSFTTFQATFLQTTIDQQSQILQHSSGTMMMMRPNHFRFETQKPEHQIVVTDGKTMWIYDVDLQQVTKQSIQKGPINPAKLLSGNVSDLVKQFNVSEQMQKEAEATAFILTPKQPNPDFKSIQIIFHNNQLTRMKIVGSMRQTSIFDFTHIIINAHLSPTLFQLNTPKNVDVLQ